MTTLAEKIRMAVLRSLKARNRYADEVTAGLTRSLKAAQDAVHRATLKYSSLGSLPDNKLAALKGLEKLQAEIDEATATMRHEQTLRFRQGSKAAFRKGIYQGIEEFAAAQLPFYRDLRPEGIEKLGTKVFTLVDTDALDFMVNYNLTLAGDVHRELSDGIKRTILTGIATGKGAGDIVRDLGEVVVDKESFRQAGTRVFSKAQYRMETIARTEVLRAHNMGRQKFHEQVGVQKLEWLAADDERMCPQCGGLDGKTFHSDKFPQQPVHPMCRCTSVVAWPLVICGGDLAAQAAPSDPAADACILPPHVLEGMADAQAHENAKLKAAFESGGIDDLSALSAKQLQTLAKQNGVALARTKSDFISLLDAAEPGVPHADLAGKALEAKLKQYGIGALRTKDELVKLLAEKQAAFKQAKLLAAQQNKLPLPEGLDQLPAAQLKELAQQQGVSLNMNKQDVIDLLNQLEPGIDHSGLSGAALSDAKKKFHIGPLKNKQQLAKALEKAAGQQLAESAKQQALDAAKTAAIQQAKEAVELATAKVAVPASPSGYKEFLGAVKDAEAALSGAAVLPQDALAGYAKEIALKKQLFLDQVGAMKSSELKELAKTTKVKHWQWAGKDDLVTLFTETDPGKVAAVQAGIEKKYAAWAEKHGGGKKSGTTEPPVQIPTEPPVQESAAPPSPAVKPSKKKPAMPSPSGPAEAPPVLKKGAEFDEVDATWEKVTAEHFKFEKRADEVGGVHTKEFWTDPEGNRWMFKPADSEYVAEAEEAAYRIMRLIDPRAVEVRTIRLNGRLGSIQQWRTDLMEQFDFNNIPVAQMTTVEIEQIQREQVIDWLIANHDSHAKQFLRGKDGHVYGIDKGQFFKNLGKDRLSVDYAPNAYANGENTPLHCLLFRAVKKGDVSVDPAVTLRYIQEVEKIADEDYLAIIRPYVEGRFKNDAAGRKAFYERALDRKHKLRKDFEGFYADVLGQKDFHFDALIPRETKMARFGKAEVELVEDAARLGWQGKTMPIDSVDIEDQNALIFTESKNGSPRTVVKMKVRPDSEGKLLDAIKKGRIEGGAKPKVGEPLEEDRFQNDLLLAIKTVNHHAADKQFNQSKLQAALKHRDALKKLLKSPDEDLRDMATEYLAWLDRVDDAVQNGTDISSLRFSPYLRKHIPAETKSDGAFTVRKTKVQLTRRSLAKGEISVVEEDVANTQMFRRQMKDGEQYNFEFDDGTLVRYRPWSGANLYAQRGELEILSPGKATPEKVEAVMAHLGKLGLDSRVAQVQQAERMYLEKMAYVSKVDKDAKWEALLKDLDKREASDDVRVAEMRRFWEDRLGVSNLTRLPGYNPQGEYQVGFQDQKARGGYRHQLRFDLSDEDLEREMKGYALKHRLTNGEKVDGFVELVLENNGAMISTVEKMRVGVPPGGMSPEQDMDSGGATYFFTRIHKMPAAGAPSEAGLYFKKRLLRRMDAISYDHDAYGRVTDDYVASRRGSTPAEWKSFARQSGNETIFKNSVMILDDIELIVTGNDAERKRTLASFHKRGIRRLPDGRDVENIVVVRGSGN